MQVVQMIKDQKLFGNGCRTYCTRLIKSFERMSRKRSLEFLKTQSELQSHFSAWIFKCQYGLWCYDSRSLQITLFYQRFTLLSITLYRAFINYSVELENFQSFGGRYTCINCALMGTYNRNCTSSRNSKNHLSD